MENSVEQPQDLSFKQDISEMMLVYLLTLRVLLSWVMLGTRAEITATPAQTLPLCWKE